MRFADSSIGIEENLDAISRLEMCVKRGSYMDFWNKVIETFKKWRQGPGNDTFDPEAFFREIKQMGWLVDQCVFAGFMGEEGSLSNNPRPTAAISPPASLTASPTGLPMKRPGYPRSRKRKRRSHNSQSD